MSNESKSYNVALKDVDDLSTLAGKKFVDSRYGRVFSLCIDLDNCCHEVNSKTQCWLHNPALGICPFLVVER